MSWGYDETYTVPNHDVMGGGFFFCNVQSKKNEGLSPMTLRGVYGPTNHWGIDYRQPTLICTYLEMRSSAAAICTYAYESSTVKLFKAQKTVDFGQFK